MATRLCPNCKIAAEAEARFCVVCGAAIPTTAPLANTPTDHRKAESGLIRMVNVGGKSVRNNPASGVPSPVPLSKSQSSAPSASSPAHLAAKSTPPPPTAGRGPGPVSTTPSGSNAVPRAIPAVGSSPVASTRDPIPVTLDSLVGRTLNNRYIVKRKIGEGGFGAVFEGMQVATERLVALKVLHPHSVADPTIVARFKREAEACSKLRNPHTVIIYDFDQTEDGVLYLAMELVRGKSLQEIQRANGYLSQERTLHILEQVAEALGEAHGHGIIHRDMKPENIMVESRDGEDYVKVLDFGIAKIISDDSSRGAPALTAIGQTVGTLEFMSPEQLRGKPLDGRSDIYALGMVAYEILTGELPFKNAKSTTEVIQFHLQESPPAPSSMNPDANITLPVDELIQKMVAKRQEDRHENAEELRRHISDALKSMDKRAIRMEAKRLALVIGALVLVVVGLIYFLRR